MPRTQMSNSNVIGGQAKWAWSSYSRIKKVSSDGARCHLVCRVPRDAFRQSAMTFGEIKQSSPIARYWNMTLQLFLETLREMDKKTRVLAKVQQGLPPVVQKIYLEWIPSEHDAEKACEYRIHAFLFEDQHENYGGILQSLLESNATAAEDNLSRSNNSRKPDPLAALADHQVHKRVTPEVYFRNVCGLACGHRRIENNLDAVSSHNTHLGLPENIANPMHVWSLKNACNNCRNPEYRDEDAQYVNGHFTFLDTKRVIRITNGQLYTKTFLGKYLPDYQSFVDSYTKPTQHVSLPSNFSTDEDQPEPVNNKDEPVRADDHRLDLNVYGEHDISTLSEQEQARIDAFSSRSDFALMAENAKAIYIGNCEKYENDDDPSLFQKHYHIDYKKQMMSEFLSRCLNPDANISDKGKIIIKWMERRNPPAYKGLYKFDRNLSLFANRVIKIMEEAEQFFLISTAHREFYQVMHARLDAYRRDFGLHLNIFQTGEGATSKSFLFDLMKSCSIEGTIDQLTYETAKANAVDGNRNDCITVCHEAPPGMFRASRNRNMDSSAEAMFKERLTSNHVSCKTFVLDEATGKRSQRVTKSECIGVWFGATNDPPDEVEEALKTRFHWGNFEKIKRPGKDIDDCINGERALSRKDKLRRAEVILEWKEEQARVFIVEKMIWCGLIKDVEMSAFYIIKQKFKKLFDGKSVREAETRDWQRIFIFARIQAICTALAAVFQVEPDASGKNCYGQQFSVEQLLRIEPFLVCTEEMVFFTLTMMDSQFVHPAEHKILRKVFNMQKNIGKLTFGNPTPDDTEATHINHNYIKINGNLGNISSNIQQNMGSAEGKTSAHNIKAYLLDLTKASIKSREHILPPNVEGDEGLVWPVEQTTGRETRMMSAICTGDALFVHVKLLQNHQHSDYDPVLDTINRITHTFQKPKSVLIARRYTYKGKVLTAKQYHIFDVIKRVPVNPDIGRNGKDKNMIRYTNVLHNSKESKMILGQLADDKEDESRKHKEIDIDMDLDDWAKEKRSDTLRITIEDYEDWGKRMDIPTISYPVGMVKSVKKRDDIESAKQPSGSSSRKRKASDDLPNPKVMGPPAYTGLTNESPYGIS